METSNDALWASIMNNKETAMNNPFLWLVFLAMFGRNGFGGFGGCGDSGLSQTIADNHNSDLLMGAIKGNADAAASLASQLNVGVDTINAAINSLGSTFQSCCCNSRMDTQKMGYENQISNLQQTNSLMSRIDQLANGVQSGFSQIGYATAQQTCDLKTNQNENTQRIVDVLNNHWTSELSQKYADAKLELSQSNQTAALIAALKG